MSVFFVVIGFLGMIISTVYNVMKYGMNNKTVRFSGVLTFLFGILFIWNFLTIFPIPAFETSQPSTANEEQITETAVVEELEPEVEEKRGIIVEQFNSGVDEYFNIINSADTGAGDMGFSVTTQGSSAFVKVIFYDLSLWSNSTNMDKKELINSLGQNLNIIAAKNVYSEKDIVDVTVKIYSPSGLEMGEYTAFGNVKLYN
jgi:hypothetical protein